VAGGVMPSQGMLVGLLAPLRPLCDGGEAVDPNSANTTCADRGQTNRTLKTLAYPCLPTSITPRIFTPAQNVGHHMCLHAPGSEWEGRRMLEGRVLDLRRWEDNARFGRTHFS
jgi:hypothetical protein